MNKNSQFSKLLHKIYCTFDKLRLFQCTVFYNLWFIQPLRLSGILVILSLLVEFVTVLCDQTKNGVHLFHIGTCHSLMPFDFVWLIYFFFLKKKLYGMDMQRRPPPVHANSILLYWCGGMRCYFGSGVFLLETRFTSFADFKCFLWPYFMILD